MKQEIKDYILNNKIINDFISKVKDDKRGDFISHIWLIILEKDNNRIEELYYKGELGKYIIGIMLIQLKMTNSEFNQIWKDRDWVDVESVNKEVEPYIEIDGSKRLKIIFNTIRNVRPVDQVLFRMYYGIDDDNNFVEPKTFKEIQEITGLKYHTIRKSVLRTKGKIK